MRLLRGTAVALAVLALLGVAVIEQGMFDPPLPGTVLGQTTLEAQTLLPHEQHLTWLAQRLLPPDTLRLSVGAQGAENVLAGLVLGDEAAFLVVAVSPLGYVTIWQKVGNLEPTMLLPLQTWPHVHIGAGLNEIQVENEGNGRFTVRINREWLWQGEANVGPGVGLMAENRGEGTAVIHFQQLQWQDSPP